MPHTAAAASGEEAISRAAALASKLAERAGECERLGRVPEATVADFIDAGLHRITQPRKYGGWAMDWATHVAAALELGKGDGSQGWVLAGYGAHAQAVGAFGEEAQDEVWTPDSAALVACSPAPVGRLVLKNGSYVVSGTWPLASGIDQAKWLLAGGFIEGEERRQAFALIPRAELEVSDDWQVVGLTGAGSKSVTAGETRVPAHRVLEAREYRGGTGPGARTSADSIYKIPALEAPLALAGVTLGIGAAMLEDFVALARDSAKRGRRVSDNFATALRISESRADLDSAIHSTLAAAQETTTAVTRGQAPSAERHGLNALTAAYAAKAAARAADRIFAAAGAKAIYLSNRLYRCMLDIHAVGTQEAFAWDTTASIYGRVRLGETL